MFTARYGLSYHTVEVDISLHNVKRNLAPLPDALNIPSAEASEYFGTSGSVRTQNSDTADSTDAASQAARNIGRPYICRYSLINVPITLARTVDPPRNRSRGCKLVCSDER